MRLMIAVVLLVFCFGTNISAAVPVHEDGSTRVKISRASSGMELRRVKKMGIGLSAAGSSGLLGADFELNFTPQFSFMGGFGFGSGFQTFNLKIRRYLGGNSFLPYAAAGFSRWHSGGQHRFDESNPSYLSKKFLNREERESGEFGENLIYPAFGLQYMHLGGEWNGLSFFTEVIILLDIDDLVMAPTGGLGMTYYF